MHVPGPAALQADDLDCIVLCGGLGTRLRDAAGDRVKPMAEVSGRPFLEWLLLSLRAAGVARVTLATGHRADAVEAYFGDGRALGMALRHSRETAPLGTGGAAKLALSGSRARRVLLVNGDSYCRLDLDALLDAHLEARARATLLLTRVEDCSRYGAVDVDASGTVTAFAEKREAGPGWVSSGVCMIERGVIDEMDPGSRSLEHEVLPRLLGRGLNAVHGSGPFVDIGTPESYASAAEVLEPEFGALGGDTAASATRTVREHFAQTVATTQELVDRCTDDIVRAARLIAAAFGSGHKLLLCGNGGSAADCQHMAAEFVSRLRIEVDRPGLPALALTTDTSFLTAYANDIDFDGVFARQVQALGNPGDVVLGISTSGGSRNIVAALRVAAERGMRTVAITGATGVRGVDVDVTVAVPSAATQVVQECMLGVEHVICELVEDELFGGRVPARFTPRGGRR